MKHTTQEPKSMQLAVELEYRREYEAAHELRTMQARIADLEAQLYAISTVEVGQSIQPPVQPDTAAQQEPVAWMYEWNGRTHITTADQRPIEHAHPHFNKSNPLYAAPQQPVQQEPVAILDIRRSKRTGELESWGFAEKPNDAKSGTYAVYTAPQPTENLRCKSTQKRLATLWGYVKQEPARQPLPADTYTALAHRIATKYAHRSDPAFCGYAFLPHTLEQFVRAIEQAHNITGGQ